MMRKGFVFRSEYLDMVDIAAVFEDESEQRNAASDLLDMICRYGIHGMIPHPNEGYHEGAVLLFLSRIQPMMDKDLK